MDDKGAIHRLGKLPPGGGWRSSRPRGGPTGTFMVECYWPGITEDEVRDALTRFNGVGADGMRLAGRVRSIGCLLVPSDGLVLFLFDGPSAAVIHDRSTWIDVPFDRIVEAVRIEPMDRLES